MEDTDWKKMILRERQKVRALPWKNFSYSVGGLFMLETISFVVQKLCNFM
jgi:hypothetical protein